jgi:hypothetical protein
MLCKRGRWQERAKCWATRSTVGVLCNRLFDVTKLYAVKDLSIFVDAFICFEIFISEVKTQRDKTSSSR